MKFGSNTNSFDSLGKLFSLLINVLYNLLGILKFFFLLIVSSVLILENNLLNFKCFFILLLSISEIFLSSLLS